MSTFRSIEVAGTSSLSCSKQNLIIARSWSIGAELSTDRMKSYSKDLRRLRWCYTYSLTDNLTGLLNCINYYYYTGFKQ